MRQVVLDTETTGLEAKEGHRIIEIGALEIVGRRITERRLHHYVNPERDSDEGALAVHGIDNDFLRDKPKFADIAHELLDFVRDAEVIIHNAAFDLEFLDAELARLGLPPFAKHCAKVTDSSGIRASAIRWTRCASATACPTAIVRCTARCSMPGCWPRCTWR
jgi:DNA polymerase-3 subunit epsilon